MTINPIKIIRDRREYKAYVEAEAKALEKHKIQCEMMSWLSQNGMLKNHVS